MNESPWVRKPAVAGLFYPADPYALESNILTMLEAAASPVLDDVPRALVAPHAGYPYSGPVAASAYAQLKHNAHQIQRVVLLGPSHHFAFDGIASTSAAVYRTPLGSVEIDTASMQSLDAVIGVKQMDEAHVPEHSVEVQLPFLQVLLPSFKAIPLVVGKANPARIAEVIEALQDSVQTLLIVSTDLSHYHQYQRAVALDRKTCRAIEQLEDRALGPDSACGHVPLAGLLRWARDQGLSVRTLDLRNSGDTAGPRDNVVGYGAWAFYSSE